jgi:putative transposase
MEYWRSSHSLYDIKYHLVFWTKYRYRVLTGPVASRTKGLIGEICSANDAEIISGSISPDHIHLLISAPPGVSISKIVQYVKGKSSRKLQQEFELLRKRYGGQHLWSRGYFVVTVGNVDNEDIQKYIEEQERTHAWRAWRRSKFSSMEER